MSGHSKWSQIKHKKAITDQKRGQLFSKLSRLITLAARDGADPEINYKLKAAIDKARSLNMPNDNIERALKRVTDKNASSLEELVIEAVGPGNIPVIIEAITDNRNRTIAEIKTLIQSYGAKPATQGSQMWQFRHKGVVTIIRPPAGSREDMLSEEDFELRLIEAGADNFRYDGEKLIITTDPAQVESVRSAVEALGEKVESAERDYIAVNPVPVEEERIKKKLIQFFDALEEHDDVKDVYSSTEL